MYLISDGYCTCACIYNCIVFIHIYAECRGFESHTRKLIFLWKSDCLGRAVLLCLFVSLTLLASFFLPSASLINVSMYISASYTFQALLLSAVSTHAHEYV